MKKAMPTTVPPESKTDWMKQVGNWIYSSGHISIEYGLLYDGIAVEQL